MAHKLNLLYNNCSNDCRIISLTDESLYDGLTPITNVSLKITVAGTCCPVFLPFAINSTNTYSSYSFGLTSLSGSLSDLPDGIYEATLSVCPNDEVYVEIKFLRTCVTRCKLLSKLSALLTTCPQDVHNCNGVVINSNRIQTLKDLLLLLECAENDVASLKYTEATDKMDYISKVLATI